MQVKILSPLHILPAKTNEPLYHSRLPPVNSAHMFLIPHITHGGRKTKRQIAKVDEEEPKFAYLANSTVTSTFLCV